LEAIRTRRAIKNPRPDSLNKYLVAMEEEKIDQLDELDIAGDMIIQL